MADLAPAFEKTCHLETGGWKSLYQNDPKDEGGETVVGIARKFNPTSSIWELVDEIKKFNGVMPLVINAALQAKIDEVKVRVREVYDLKYWKPLSLDACPSQEVAEILFDSKVLGGQPAEWLIRCLNALNKEQELYPDQAVMQILPGTFDNIEILKKKNMENTLTAGLLALRAVYLLERAEKNKTKERFVAGWINRIVSEGRDYLAT